MGLWYQNAYPSFSSSSSISSVGIRQGYPSPSSSKSGSRWCLIFSILLLLLDCGNGQPIVLVSPSPDDSGTAFIQGTTPVQVVFQLPVIKLGSNFGASDKVPFVLKSKLRDEIRGRGRWVTSYIYRFDPEGDWPTDLSLDLVWNTELQSFDGRRLFTEDDLSLMHLETPTLDLRVQCVHSELAANATQGMWSSLKFPPFPGTPEVPPDGRVELISANGWSIDASRLVDAFRLLEGSLKENDIRTTTLRKSGRSDVVVDLKCSTGTVVCLRLNRLKANALYTIVLPKGTLYGKESGPLREDIGLEISGMSSFRIPFKSGENAGMRFTSFLVDLAHGVEGDIAESISLYRKMQWRNALVPVDNVNITATASQIVIEAPDVLPEAAYHVFVTANLDVEDAFGQPLEQSSMSFSMAPLSPLLETAYAFSYFEPGKFDGNFALVGRHDKKLRSKGALAALKTWALDEQSLSAGLLWASSNRNYNLPPLDAIMESHGIVPTTSTAIDLPVLDHAYKELSVSKSLQKTGSFIFRLCDDCEADNFWQRNEKVSIVSTVDCHATILVREDQIVAWVTKLSDGLPISDAKIKIVAAQRNVNPLYSESWDEGEFVTDSEGFAFGTLKMSNSLGVQLEAFVVLSDGNVQFVPNLPRTYSHYSLNRGGDNLPMSRSHTRGIAVLDRKVYSPGDSIKVKGYFRQRLGKAWDVVSLGRKFGVFAVVRWPGLEEDVYIKADYFEDVGSFNASIAIPSDVDSRSSQLRILICNKRDSLRVKGRDDEELGDDVNPCTLSGQHLLLSNLDFVIASVRLPTASLELESEKVVLRKDANSIALTASTSTLTGASISDSQIDIVWRLSSTSYPFHEYQGFDTVRTGDDGSVDFLLDLKKTLVATEEIEFSLHDGDYLSVTAEWVGPVGERLTSTVDIPVYESDIEVSIELTVPQPVPGFEFGITATTAPRVLLEDSSERGMLESESDDSSSSIITVTMSLNGTELPRVICREPAGTMCRTSLPQVGVYRIQACAKDQGMRESCDSRIIGKSIAEWNENPLSSLEGGGIGITYDRSSSFSTADNFTIEIDSVFASGRLMVFWGPGGGKVASVEISEGLQSFNISLEDCLGLCSIFAVVHVPRQPQEWSLPQNTIPTSMIFDPGMPQTFTQQIFVEVMEEDEENSKLKSLTAKVIVPNSAAPRELLEVRVELSDSISGMPVDGEITVAIIDKASLLVAPNPLPDLNSPYSKEHNDIQEYCLYTSSASYLLPSGADKSAVAKWSEIQSRNPWITESLYGHFERRQFSYDKFPLDMDDVHEYLARFEQCLTSSCGTSYGMRCGTSYGSRRFISNIRSSEDSENYRVAADGMRDAVPTSSPMPYMQSDSSADMSQREEQAMSIRDNFVVTPFFEARITIDESGSTTIPVMLPDNIGAFEIRVLAASRSKGFDAVTSDLIVQKRLSLIAQAPQIVRVGDTFEAGVSISLMEDSDPSFLRKQVVLKGESLCAGLKSSNDETWEKYIGIKPGEALTASFWIHAFSVDRECSLSIRATLVLTDFQPQSLATDSIFIRLPVIESGPEAYLSTSVSLKGRESDTEWTEGLSLPEAQPGSGALQVAAGVGWFGAVLNYVDYVISTPRDWQLAQWGLSLLLAIAAQSSFTDRLDSRDLPNDDHIKTMSVRNATKVIELLTDPIHGLQSNIGTKQRMYTDVRLQAVAISILSQTVQISTSLNLADLANTMTLIPIWKHSMEEELIQNTAEILQLSRGRCPSLPLVAVVRFANGIDWEVEPSVSQFGKARKDIISCLSMERIYRDVESLPVAEQVDEEEGEEEEEEEGDQSKNLFFFHLKAIVIITVLDHYAASGETLMDEVDIIQNIFSSFFSKLRITGETAYIASSQGSMQSSGLRSNALALLALTKLAVYQKLETGLDALSLPPAFNVLGGKMAAYVAGGLNARRGGQKMTTIPIASHEAISFAALSLSWYDSFQGSSMPNLSLNITTDTGFEVLRSHFESVLAHKIARVSIPWEDLPDSTSRLHSSLQGVGEVNLHVAMKWIPEKVPTFPVYRGLFVSRAFREYDIVAQEPKGLELTGISRGKVVAITLEVTSFDDIGGSVTFEDRLPAGLEALDPNIFPEARAQICPNDGLYLWNRLPFMRWWRPCPAVEMKPGLVLAVWPRLGRGTYEMTYLAVAATVGNYSIPQARAYISDQPEVYGMSAGGGYLQLFPEGYDNSDVRENTNTVIEMKLCEPDCQNGICNLVTGRCICDANFADEACSSFTSEM